MADEKENPAPLDPSESAPQVKEEGQPSLIDEALKIKKEIQDERKKLEEEKASNQNLLEQLKVERGKIEKAVAENIVQGRSKAGIAVEKSDDEKAKDEARKLLEGTGLNPFN